MLKKYLLMTVLSVLFTTGLARAENKFEILLTPANDVMFLEESNWLSIILQNKSEEIYTLKTLDILDDEKGLSIKVMRNGEKLDPKNDATTNNDPLNLNLAKNQYYEYYLNLSKRFDLSSAGEYAISVSFKSEDGSVFTSDEKKIRIEPLESTRLSMIFKHYNFKTKQNDYYLMNYFDESANVNHLFLKVMSPDDPEKTLLLKRLGQYLKGGMLEIIKADNDTYGVLVQAEKNEYKYFVLTNDGNVLKYDYLRDKMHSPRLLLSMQNEFSYR